MYTSKAHMQQQRMYLVNIFNLHFCWAEKHTYSTKDVERHILLRNTNVKICLYALDKRKLFKKAYKRNLSDKFLYNSENNDTLNGSKCYQWFSLFFFYFSNQMFAMSQKPNFCHFHSKLSSVWWKILDMKNCAEKMKITQTIVLVMKKTVLC